MFPLRTSANPVRVLNWRNGTVGKNDADLRLPTCAIVDWGVKTLTRSGIQSVGRGRETRIPHREAREAEGTLGPIENINVGVSKKKQKGRGGAFKNGACKAPQRRLRRRCNQHFGRPKKEGQRNRGGDGQ